MRIVRYAERASGAIRVGVARAAVGSGEGQITELTGIGQIAELLRLPLKEIKAHVEASTGTTVRANDVLLLPPIDGHTEVWASGVTYERSKSARMEESTEADIYDRVYDAERPELFFKAPAWRVVTDGEPIGIREDSGLDVPEPELGLIVNAYGEIVGFAACNDVSSRAIEGDNPLYLPQAKVYAGSCAIGTAITPAWSVDDPYALTITISVQRSDSVVWQGETTTARLHRKFDDLVDHLFRGDAFPDGAVLLTGTGIVPELDLNDPRGALAAGDRVDITIGGVGHLSNPVVAGKEALTWLVAAVDNPFVRETVR